METEQPQEINVSDLKSIERYFWILVESYPESINQTELAKRAGVTRAAVSQIRDELIKICDLKSLAYEKKLVLKKEPKTGFSLLAFLFMSSTPDYLKKYVSSQYFDDIVEKSNFYEKITENLVDYNLENFFTKEDLNWLYYFIKNKFIAHEPEIIGNVVFYEIEDDLTKHYFLPNLPINLQLLYSALNDKSLIFLHKKSDFIKLLELRDKIWFFIMRNKKIYETLLTNTIEWLEIEEGKQEDENIDDALETLLKHLIKKILKKYTSYIHEEAMKSDIELNKKYINLGSIFKI